MRNGALTQNCTELNRLPSECIADNALRAKWSARDDLHVQGCLILSQVGLLFPVNHAPLKLASLTGFAPVIPCMRGRHVGWTTPQGQKWWGGSGECCPLCLSHVKRALCW